MGDRGSSAGWAGGGFVYFLGIIGSWVWFWGRAEGFWEYVGAFFQGFVWPGFMVYELFAGLSRLG